MLKADDFKVFRSLKFWVDTFILIFLIFLVFQLEYRDSVVIPSLLNRLEKCSK